MSNPHRLKGRPKLVAIALSGQRSMICMTTRGRYRDLIIQVGKPTVGGEFETQRPSTSLNQGVPHKDADNAKLP